MSGVDHNNDVDARARPGADELDCWLTALTPDASADMREIIEATNPRSRATAINTARDNGRSWSSIATSITANKQRPPAY